MCHTHYTHLSHQFDYLAATYKPFPLVESKTILHLLVWVNCGFCINIVLENFDCITSVKELRYAAMMRHVRLYHIHVIVTHMKVICTVYSTKSGGKAWKDLSRDAHHCWHHVQSAHIWVCSLPFSLFSLNSVHSFRSVCPASPIATGSIVASYSMRHQQWHTSHDKSFQAFPPLFIL